MMFQKYIFYLILTFSSFCLNAQKFGFNKVLEKSPLQKVPFSIENTPQNKAFLDREGIVIKNKSKNWLFFTASSEWIAKQMSLGKIDNFYFEYTPATILDDTARAMHYVDSVHFGVSPLLKSYTGKGVIVGIVDSGLDYNHPDLIDSLGRKRVIRYWDHTNISPTVSPQPYNYGQIWYESDIQNGVIPINPNDAGHGTTVTGICAGNGLANGKNRGMAPEADIIFVKTNFNLSNWTLTVADACDYIFKVADSLKKPAVINLSVGSSLGSHDGTDPAGELMSQLVEAKGGRIIVGAAGNSGANAPFHAQQFMTVTDTNFIWFENNPDGALGNNTVFFDLWSNINDAQFSYSFGANRNGPSFKNVASTQFRFAQINVGTPIYDTLYNEYGDRIATIEIYTEYQANNFHLQGYFSKVDSTDYLMRFSTTGIGKYDLWSGKEMGLNKIVSTNLPSVEDFPSIVNYVMPDSAQSIVSSWNCAANILSVGNVRARLGYTNVNGDQYYPADMTKPGKISPNSSRGPARNGTIKPDVCAAGQVTLAAAPMYYIEHPEIYYDVLGEGGYHARNGGTSMASPVVAGIAALYLERCIKGTAEDFKTILFETSYGDNFTGNLPNNRYGHGKINAFDLLIEKNGNLKILGDTAICQTPTTLTSNIPLLEYNWSNGTFDNATVISNPTSVWLEGIDMMGCKIYSDTVIVQQGSPLSNPTISINGDTLVASPSPNYQWYFNDSPISGATQQSYVPTQNGYYSVAVQGTDNCKSFSNAVSWTLDLQKEELLPIIVYPNPAKDYLIVETIGVDLTSIEMFSITGQSVYQKILQGNKSEVDVRFLSSGAYLIRVNTPQGGKILPFFKN